MRTVPLPVLKMAVEKNDKARDFAAALSANRINVIAELKKASPSRGVIRQDYTPAALAPQLAGAGAAALSVLTEEEFFQGELEHLKVARKAVSVPALRKDFILDPWQVWETRASGGDSFLLIVAVLDDSLLRSLLALGQWLGMEPLVEVHTPEDLDRALAAGARIVGVNNRDLRTFEVRLETSLVLIERIPEECIAVSESGIRSRDDLQQLRAAGFDAFLVGEQLMRAADPATALREMVRP